VANDGVSSWISYYNPPTLPDETGATTQYQLRFSAASAGSVTVRWLSDNSSALYLNGQLVGTRSDATPFSSWNTPITINLAAGLNTIDLDVYNLPQSQPTWGNPTGGRVEFSGSVLVSAVPEPTTVIAGFGALGLLLFGAGVHKKRSVLRIGK
jgi:hypothetical protein